ncbi:MAG: hypothetical protein J1G01_04460 [Clostridiales bacterium]|nr:hypothetical protein [Clostridiales bacterium]
MEQQKAIDEMATDLDDCLVWISGDEGDEIETKETAANLIRFGYGNIHQARTEFAERLKKRMFANGFRTALYSYIIDETLKEFLHE